MKLGCLVDEATVEASGVFFFLGGGGVAVVAAFGLWGGVVSLKQFCLFWSCLERIVDQCCLQSKHHMDKC